MHVTQKTRLSSLGWKIPWRREWQPTPVFLPRKPMDRGSWWARVHGVAKSQTWLSNWAQSTVHLSSANCRDYNHLSNLQREFSANSTWEHVLLSTEVISSHQPQWEHGRSILQETRTNSKANWGLGSSQERSYESEALPNAGPSQCWSWPIPRHRQSFWISLVAMKKHKEDIFISFT